MIFPMAPSKQKFREIVFQFLYSRDFEMSDWELISALIMRQHAITKAVAKGAKERAEAVWHLKEVLDQAIAVHSKEYSFERITRIEQTVLRLGLYELLHTDLPPKVSLNEAVRLARKYATREGAAFVNALLDAIYKERENEALSREEVPL